MMIERNCCDHLLSLQLIAHSRCYLPRWLLAFSCNLARVEERRGRGDEFGGAAVAAAAAAVSQSAVHRKVLSWRQ